MGYESKLYIVEKTSIVNEVNGKRMRWGQIIAMFDLSKVYDVSSKMTEYPQTDTFFFMEDGNTEVYEDCYGKPLTEVPVEDAIAIIEEAVEREKALYGDCYRRYMPCLQALKSLDLAQWGEVVVLHFGY